jgi:hypothetical protein
VLLLTCLGVNIVFFSEVRESFLGGEDPLASVASSFSELDIRGKIAGFYEKKPAKVDDVQASPTPEPPKEEPRAPKEQRRKPAPLESTEPVPVVAPEGNLQTVAKMPVPQPTVAAVKPAVAEQFKPIAHEHKSAASVSAASVSATSVKPSSHPVWETIDTVLERPVWYE